VPGLLSDRVAKTEKVVVIPAAVDTPRGLYRVTLAAICASVFALFAALVIAYFWRAQTAAYWVPVHLPGAMWFSTTIILLSSGTCEIGRQLFGRGFARRASPWFMGTAMLGAAFLASQLTAWRGLAEQGLFLAKNPHSSFFYLFTAAHGAHLIGGLVALAVILLRQRKRRELVDTVSYYWHFLSLLWLGLFAVLLIF
jgi:cytochrome c oxidase subunit 3